MSAVRSVFLVITATSAKIRLDLFFKFQIHVGVYFEACLFCKTKLFNLITVVCHFLSACFFA